MIVTLREFGLSKFPLQNIFDQMVESPGALKTATFSEDNLPLLRSKIYRRLEIHLWWIVAVFVKVINEYHPTKRTYYLLLMYSSSDKLGERLCGPSLEQKLSVSRFRDNAVWSISNNRCYDELKWVLCVFSYQFITFPSDNTLIRFLFTDCVVCHLNNM